VVFAERLEHLRSQPLVRRRAVHLGVPEHVDRHRRQLDRVGSVAQFERRRQALGEPLGDGGHQLAAPQDGPHAHEVRHRQPRAALHAGAADQLVHLAVAGAGRHDDQVLGRLEVGQRHAPAVQRVALAEQAHIALPEQAALEEPGLELRQRADGQVHLA
jgi:hypothetical protein